jgi:hypothetical protein
MAVSNRLITRCWLGVALSLLTVAGCGDSAPPVPTPPEITEKKFIGKWVENRSMDVSIYYKPSDEPDFRMLDVRPDGTFAYYLSDEAGKPKGDAVVEGTWAVSEPIVTLKVSKNTLPPDKEPETPARIIRVYTPENEPGLKVPIIYAGSDNLRLYYKKID